jgi:hypothetical protein
MTEELIETIDNFFIEKYGKTAGRTAIINLCCIASMKVKNLPILLNVLKIAPSRQYKSQVQDSLIRILSNSCPVVRLPSNITAHGLIEDIERNKIRINDRAMSLNDMNVTLSGRSRGLKATFMNTMSELLSEGTTGYSNKPSGGTHTIQARTCMMANISSDAYNEHRKLIYSTTFGNRFLKNYYNVPLEEQEKLSETKGMRFKLKWDCRKITLKQTEIKLSDDMYAKIREISRKLLPYALSPNYDDFLDKIIALIEGYTLILGETEVNDNSLKILERLEEYIKPLERHEKIMVELLKGASWNDIQDKFSMNSTKPLSRAYGEIKSRLLVG